jgi:DNA repair exonuclease SbcCD ATPase subunit
MGSKIAQIVYENFKKLSLKIVPDGNSTKFKGKNGVGKSTAIDGIWNAITGQDIPKQPIQIGKMNSFIELEIKNDDGSSYFVKRTFTEASTTLTVTTKDGARYGSPQKFLDDKLGSISFDPFDFINKQPKDQKAWMMKFLNLDLTEFETKKKDANAKIDLAKKELNTLNSSLSATPAVPELYRTKKEITEVTGRLNKANEIVKDNKEIDNKIKNIRTSIDGDFMGFTKGINSQIIDDETSIKTKKEQIERLKQEIKDLEAGIESKKEKIKTSEAEITELEKQKQPDPDIKAINDEISTIESHNNNVAQHEKREKLIKDIEEANKKLQKAKDDYKKIESDRIDAIKKANMPVEGLDFSEDGLLFNGLNFSTEQLSHSEIIKIGIQISIAVNPNLRIIRIKDASLLDDETFEIVKKMADESDYQLFTEHVTNDSELVFEFEQKNDD